MQAGDLAWTATFSSLTSNTAITDVSAVWNYGVFFLLTWHLWATQTTYDIRYYTDDWWHRFCFVAQLGVYAIIAACSGTFNIGWKIFAAWTETFKGDATTLTYEAMRANRKYTIMKSFTSINIWLFVSRMLLCIQYARGKSLHFTYMVVANHTLACCSHMVPQTLWSTLVKAFLSHAPSRLPRRSYVLRMLPPN